MVREASDGKGRVSLLKGFELWCEEVDGVCLKDQLLVTLLSVSWAVKFDFYMTVFSKTCDMRQPRSSLAACDSKHRTCTSVRHCIIRFL